MTKIKKAFRCEACGFEDLKLNGKCPSCGQWNTMKEIMKSDEKLNIKPSLSDDSAPKRLKDVDDAAFKRFSTGISECDRIFGGGVVTDSIIIFAGAPGTGKSTLLMQISNNVGISGKKVLYISGEESEGQVKARATRVTDDNISENVWIKSETNMNRIEEYIKEIDPQLIIIDSIQTLYKEESLPSRAGGATQIMDCTDDLMAIAKRNRKAIFIIGHITKNNELAGVKTLEHMVDAVFYIEGDHSQQLRIIRSSKNRFGSTEEISLLSMEANGLQPIDNPCEYFLTKRSENVVGCALTVSLEGTRPLVIEVESLVDKSAYGNPMRIAKEVDRQQLQVLTAILEKRAGLQLGFKDVYIKVSGGIKVTEPAVNLGILMAIASSYANKALDNSSIFIGEVGLTGELKPVPQINRRLNEIAKLGFQQAFIPSFNYKGPAKIGQLNVIKMENIKQVIKQTLQSNN